MTAAAIRISGLGRSFGDLQAVSGVELEIEAGSTFGLLGPDGAGKTTLIRMLATVLAPTSGDATVAGASVVSEAGLVRPAIGYMPQKFSMYPDLTVKENLEFFSRLRGVPRQQRRQLAPDLLERMGMGPFADRAAGRLSGGMKQKLMLAATLMHSPQVLLLDEPTTGVDPVSRLEFWRILADIHTRGTTVLVATPYMDEAERCTTIAFLDQGGITATGTPADLKAQVEAVLLEVNTDRSRELLDLLRSRRDLGEAHLLGDAVRVLAPPSDDPAARLGSALLAEGVSAEIRPIEMDMESVYTWLAGHREAA